jgi:hypothetical protein
MVVGSVTAPACRVDAKVARCCCGPSMFLSSRGEILLGDADEDTGRRRLG